MIVKKLITVLVEMEVPKGMSEEGIRYIAKHGISLDWMRDEELQDFTGYKASIINAEIAEE